MVAFTNEARLSIKNMALASLRKMSELKPSDDGMTLEEIRDTIWCLHKLIDECDSEIRKENMKRYIVYETFEDGTQFRLYADKDRYTCEVWMANHRECTNALRIGKSHLVLEEAFR